MKNEFSPASEIPSLQGKVILVTGGNEGLGKETVLQLSKHQPSKIFLAARNQQKAEAAITEIKSKAGSDAAPIEFLKLDLASFASIKSAASDLQTRTDRLDILVANAGVMGVTGVTEEGYEMQFGVNHLGTSLLVRLLLPLQQKTASLPGTEAGSVRCVILASDAEKLAPKTVYTFDKIKTDLKDLGMFARYGQSKMANLHYTAQLAKHFPPSSSGIKFVSVHPGGVKTNLGSAVLAGWPTLQSAIRKVAGVLLNLVPVEEGARNQLWAAAATAQAKLGEPKNGVFYHPIALENKGSKRAYDDKLAEELWEWTEKELGEHLAKTESSVPSTVAP